VTVTSYAKSPSVQSLGRFLHLSFGRGFMDVLGKIRERPPLTVLSTVMRLLTTIAIMGIVWPTR
jgi:hypothetical protein